MNPNKNKFATFYAIGLILLFIFGCKKVDDFGEINNNPGATTSPVTSALLTNVLSAIPGQQVFDGGGASSVSGLFCQYFAETQYTESSRYQKQTISWDAFYSGVVYDLQNIINYNSAPGTADIAAKYGANRNQIAISRILKAYYFWVFTDRWGDIPYSEALKGNGTPKYDRQEDIYSDLLKELKAAVAQFDDAGLPFSGDILYGGDNAKWKKLANSMRMMISLRMSKSNPGTGKNEFAAALNDAAGSINTNADNAGLKYPGGAFQNPVYNYYDVVKRKDYAVAKTVTDILVNTSDPRATAFGSSTVGFPYGLERDQAVTFANSNVNWARVVEGSRRVETSPLYFITASQMLLARAEAAQLGWTSENPGTLYNSAIKANFEQWGVYSDVAFNAYISRTDISLAGGSELQKIGIQRWLSHFPDGNQGWSEWRRTGFPVLIPAPGTTGGIPRRFAYGNNEPALNPKNYSIAASFYTVAGEMDSQNAKIWWDK